uniref:Uncharacterized protein n=1 Tax=Trypanosoma congolense (strain IL3000) TaxID=1068625 RepID=G0ULI0_TRYCI|nr:hypothetical protein, unlikely [Trypanosoma congolense IL3000]
MTVIRSAFLYTRCVCGTNAAGWMSDCVPAAEILSFFCTSGKTVQIGGRVVVFSVFPSIPPSEEILLLCHPRVAVHIFVLNRHALLRLCICYFNDTYFFLKKVK